MNREQLGAIVGSIGKIAGTLGVPGADIVGMTFKDLLGQAGVATAGKSGAQIYAEAEQRLEEAIQEREDARTSAADAIRKRREARGE